MQYQSNQENKKRQTLNEKRISKVSFELGVPEDIVEKSIDVLFTFIKGKMEKPDLKTQDLLTEEEFKAQVPIIKIPHLGFVVPSYKVYSTIKKRQK
jgi:hypothetical protein